jgi:hypothetical protein
LNILYEISRIFNGIFQEQDFDRKKDYNYIYKIFDILQKFIEKKPYEIKINLNKFIEILLSYRNTKILGIRAKLGKILLNLFKSNFEISIKFHKKIFFFFFNNIRVEYYQMNLSSSEFFLFLLENKESLIKNIYNENKDNNNNNISNISNINNNDDSDDSNDNDEDSNDINLIYFFDNYLKE